METFFRSVPDENKLKLPTGEILKDTAILPGFVADRCEMDIEAVWKSLQVFENHPVDQDIQISPTDPKWITGDHPALKYRGNAIKRHKIWLQKDFEKGMLRYGYTGWQWKVSGGVKDITEVPLVKDLFDKVADIVGHDMNAVIATKYCSGLDNIGFHSDKIRDFEENTCFVVIKMGEARPFEFSWDEPAVAAAKVVIQKSKDKDEIKRARQVIKNRDFAEVFYSQTLPAGTAIIVGMEANQRVKHGVPAITTETHMSGSLVGRSIKTRKSWDEVNKEIKKSSSGAMKRKRKDKPNNNSNKK